MGAINLPKVDVEYSSPNCSGCGLNPKSRVPLFGEGKRGILIITECQDVFTQQYKSYGSGMRFEFIKKSLWHYGIMASRDCWATSAIQCFMQDIKDDKERKKRMQHCVDCCQPNLIAIIKKLKPRLIIGFGDIVARALLDGFIKDGTYVERTHGFLCNLRKYSCQLMLTFNPAKAARGSVNHMLIERDILRAVAALDKPYKAWKDEASCIRRLSESEAIAELEKDIADTTERWHAIDYETTGIKPHNPDQHIISLAIATSVDDCYAFLVTDKMKDVLVRYMQTKHIKKIAQNMKFEDNWTFHKLGVWIERLTFDPLLVMHILDNRDTGILSIKFMAGMLLGTPSWNDHIEALLSPTSAEEERRGKNAVNQIHQIPVRHLLTYNGIDSLVELRVAFILMEEIKNYVNTFPEGRQDDTPYKRRS